MTNREKLLNTNIYDLLVIMQENIYEGYSFCAIDLIIGKIHNCPDEMKGKVGAESRLAVCKDCIQKYLNMEV